MLKNPSKLTDTRNKKSIERLLITKTITSLHEKS